MRFAVAVLLVMLLATTGQAVVKHVDTTPADQPPDAVLGCFGGGSCVVVAPDWILATIHQGGDVGNTATINGGKYVAKQVFYTPYDLKLVQLGKSDGSPAGLTEYVDLCRDAKAVVGKQIVIGGYGLGRGALTTVWSGTGYAWASPSVRRWGTNTLEMAFSNFVYSDFDGPSANGTTSHEGALAAGDSGGGWFFKNAATGRWEVVGICHGVQTANASVFSPTPDLNDAISVAMVASWISETIAENSSAPPPAPATVTLTVTGGTGSGTYPSGTAVAIAAQVPAGQTFVRWTGDVATLADVTAPQTSITLNADCQVTAVFEAPISFSATLDWNWAYQNAPVTTRDRHLCVLTLQITSDPNGNSEYDVTVGPGAASQGQVVIEPTLNPLVWNIKGGRAGLEPIGGVTLQVSIVGLDRGGCGNASASLTVRCLGDVTGDGYVSIVDKFQMLRKIAGKSVRYADRCFDLNGDGVCGDSADKAILNSALNGLEMP